MLRPARLTKCFNYGRIIFMSIARLSFPEGAPLPTNPNTLHVEVAKLVVANSGDLELLPQGDYDITPEIWTRNTHNHLLTVLDNGEGRYRMAPRESTFGYQMAESEGLGHFQEGGRQQHIDSNNPIVILGGGHPTKPDLQLFGIVVYL